MIKHIAARNFLSLKEVDLELGPRNVLVGPNMAGKSNFIECLKFLRDAASMWRTRNDLTSLQEAIFNRGGFHELVWKGQPRGPISLTIEADLDHNDSVVSYRYELVLALHEYGYAQVELERLTATTGGKQHILIDNSAANMKIVDGGTTSEHPRNTLGLGLEAFGRNSSSLIGRFCDFVASWRFYNLVPALMRQSNPPTWVKFLSEHGENLSAWLLTLQNHTEEFRRLKQVCCDVLPGLGDLLFQPVERPQSPLATGTQSATVVSANISVGASENAFKKPTSLARMSDGELAFLGLISIILAPEDLSPPLLCIEEPENYLHPRLVEIFVELLDQRVMEARAPQILSTTHSLFLVDKLTIDDLIVVGKNEGATRFTRPSTKKHLKKLLSQKELSLGDLWYSGALSDS